MIFGVLFIVFVSLIFVLFVCINWIRAHLSWNLSQGVLENCLWVASKPDIQICSPWRFVEGCGKGTGCVFRLVHFNWLLWLIYNIFQVLCSSFLLLIFDLCVLYLLHQRSLILTLVLGCVIKLSLGRIQTIHMYFLPLQVCGRSWRGIRSLFISPVVINTLTRFKVFTQVGNWILIYKHHIRLLLKE